MNWLGQHIWGFISRFREKVYLEKILTGTTDKVITRELDGELRERNIKTAFDLITSVTAGNGLSGGGTSGDITLAINTAITVDKNTTQTLTNKTLTLPVLDRAVLNTSVSGSSFQDDDLFSAASSVKLASSESIKAYVDTSVASIPKGLKYQGLWNASTNSPTLQSGVGVPGYYYIVSVQGTTNLDGITDWNVGDWAIFTDHNTDHWQRLDQSEADTLQSVTQRGATSSIPITLSAALTGTTGTFTGQVQGGNLKTTTGNIISTGNLILSTTGGSNIELYTNGNAYYDAVSHIFRDSDASPTYFNITSSYINSTVKLVMDSTIDMNNNKITELATPTISTDAATKGYVDGQPGLNETLQNVTDNGNTTTNSIMIGSSSSPSNKLDVQDTSATYVARFRGASATYVQSGENTLSGESGFLAKNSTGALYMAVSSGAAYLTGTSGANTMIFGVGGSEKMRLLSTGNLGIGTTAPGGKLQIDQYTVGSQGSQGTFGNVSSFSNSGSTNLFLGIKNSTYPNRGWAFNPETNGVNSDLVIKEYGFNGERFRIKTGGNIGIGTTAPTEKLQVDGNVKISLTNGGNLQFRNGSTPNALFSNAFNIIGAAGSISDFNTYVYGNNPYSIWTNNTNRLSVTGAGNVGIGTTSPAQLLHVFGGAATIEIDSTTNESVLNFDNSSTTANIKLANNDLKIELGGSEKMRILANGRLGIGETSPSSKLHVGASDTLLTLEKSASGRFTSFGFDGSNPYITYYASNYLILGYGESTGLKPTINTMALTSTGNVGIGTTSPVQKLEVAGKIKFTGTGLIDSGGEELIFNPNDLIATSKHIQAGFGLWARAGGRSMGIDGSSTQMGLYTNGTEKVRVTSAGNVGIGNTVPSQALHITGNMRLTGAFRDRINSQGAAGYILKSTGSNGTEWIDPATLPGNADTLQEVTNNGATTTNSITFAGGTSTGALTGTSATFTDDIKTTDEINWGNNSGSYVGRLYAGGQTAVVLNTSTAGALQLSGGNATSNGGNIGLTGSTNSTPNLVKFRIGGAEAMRISAGRSLMIGTSTYNSAYKLDVNGNVRVGTNLYIGNVDAVTTATEVLVRQSERIRGITPANLVTAGGAGVFLPLSGGTLTGGLIGTTGVFSGKITTGYGVALNGGLVNYLLYGNTGDSNLYLRDMNNSAMISSWSPTAFKVHKNLTVDGTTNLVGNLGIGTTTPSAKLDIVGGNGGQLSITSGNTIWDASIDLDTGDANGQWRIKAEGADETFHITNVDQGGTSAFSIHPTTKATTLAGALTGTSASFSGNGTFGGSVNIPFSSSYGYKINTNRILSQIGGSFEFGALDYKSTYPNISVNSDGTFRILFNGTENLRVSSAGNVGIGTTAPAHPLQVQGRISTDQIQFTDSNALIYRSSNHLLLKTYAGYNINLMPSGNVGIGTETPGKKLEVSGDAVVSGKMMLGSSASGEFILRTGSPYRLAFYTNSTERFAITNGGKVGIGTTSPVSKLHVTDDTSGVLEVARFQHQQSSVVSNIALGNKAGGNNTGFDINFDLSFGGVSAKIGALRTNTGGGGNTDLHFDTNTGEKMRILSGGNVGIGTASPAYTLDVAGIIKSSSSILGTTVIVQKVTALNTNGIQFTNNGGSEKMRILDNGSVGIGTTVATSQFTVASDNSTRFVFGGQYSSSNHNRFFEAGIVANDGYLKLRNSGVVETIKLNSDGNSYLNGGNVSIGTTSPSSLFEVDSADGVMVDTFMAYFKNRESTAGDNFGLKVDAGTNSSDVSMQINNSSGAALMRVRGDGNVGVGTTSPATRLHIVGAYDTTPVKFLRHATYGNVIQLGRNAVSETAHIGYPADATINFSTAGSERLRILSTGNVGVGTSSPTERLDVSGNVKASRIISNIIRDSNGNGHLTTTVTNASTTSTVVGNTGTATTLTLGVKSSGGVVNIPNGLLTGISSTFSGTVTANSIVGNVSVYTGGILYGGSTDLQLRSNSNELFADFANNGAATLYHDNSAKFQTSATGAKILGALDLNTNKINNLVDPTSAQDAATKNYVDEVVSGVLVYQGVWNAATNSPALASGVGVPGYYYIVSVAGSTALDGISDWKVGDWAIFTDQATDKWQKIDHTNVLNGAGQGNKITKWAGSGTSYTLTDSLITDDGSTITLGGNLSGTIASFSGDINTTNAFNFTSNNGYIKVGTAWNTGVLRFLNGATTYLMFDVPNGRVQNNLGKYLTASGGVGQFGTMDNYSTAIVANGSEKMRITSAGNVGIGTTNPSHKLHVNGSVFAQGNLTAYGGSSESSTISSTGFIQLRNSGNTNVFIRSNGASYFNGGNFGIGTTGPTEKLEVSGNIKLTGSLNVGGYIHPNDESGNLSIYGGNDTTNDARILLHGSSNYWGSLELNYGYDATNSFLKISQGSSEALRITNGGKVGIGTSSPTANLDITSSANQQHLYVQGAYGEGSGALARIKTTANGNALLVESATTSDSREIFEVKNSNGTAFSVQGNGHVGIGTIVPLGKLHILTSESATTSTSLYLENTGSGANEGVSIKFNPMFGATSMIASNREGADSGKTNLTFHNCLVNDASPIERMRLTSAGNLGVGTTSPQQKLHVLGNARIEQTTNLDSKLILNPYSSGIGTSYQWEIVGKNSGGNYNFEIKEAGATYLTIKNSVGGNAGNVGIGITAPTEKLVVAGNIQVNGSSDSADGLHLKDRTFVAFSDAGSVVSRFRSSAIGSFQFQDGSYNTGINLRTNATSTFSGGGLTISGGTLTGTTANFTSNITTQGYISGPSSGLSLRVGSTEIADFRSTEINIPSVKLVMNNEIRIYNGSDYWSESVNSSGKFLIKQNGTQRGIWSGGELELTNDLIVGGGSSGNSQVLLKSAGSCEVDILNAQSEAYLRTITNHDLHFRTNNTNKMVIKTTGNVGIGTASPSATLHVIGNAGATTTIEGSTQSTLNLKTTSPSKNNYIVGTTAGDLSFRPNGVTSTTLKANGNVGIGTVSPDSPLEILSTTSPQLRVTHTDNTYYMTVGHNGTFDIVDGAGSNKFDFRRDGTSKMVILTSGNVGIGTSAPSEKLEVFGKAIIRKSGNATAHGDTDLLVTDSTAASSTAAIQILGGNAGFSNLQFSDTNSYSQGAIIYGHTDNYMAFKANASEKMRITSAGRLGVGLTNPSGLIHAKQTANDARIIVETDSNGSNSAGAYFEAKSEYQDYHGLGLFSGTSPIEKWFIGSFGSSYFSIINGKRNDGTKVLNVTTDNRVGIGTTTPAYPLDVNGQIRASSYRIGGATILSGSSTVQLGSGGGTGIITLNTTSGEGLRLNGGNVLIGTTADTGQKLQVSGDIYTGNLKLGNGETNASLQLDGEFGGGDLTVQNLGNNQDIYFKVNDGGTTNTPLSIIGATSNVGIGLSSPATKLEVNGAITAGGKISYTKKAGSLNTTGYIVAGLNLYGGGNGQSTTFTFSCGGGAAVYQKVIIGAYNIGGTWSFKTVINEGTNQCTVTPVLLASGAVTFTFKSLSGSLSFTPHVHVEIVSSTNVPINLTYI